MITVEPGARTWYGRRTFIVHISDETGNIRLHGYARREAEALARALAPIIGNRPIGALADLMARELLLHEPRLGQEWSMKL
jgi:hypothetical protein